MSLTESEAQDLLLGNALTPPLVHILGGSGRIDTDFLDNWNVAEYLYSPDETLCQRLNDFKRWCETKTDEDAGELMEELAFLAFRCLKGWDSIKSYQSYAAQHDLVISGSQGTWLLLLMPFLHLPTEGRTIVVEAKNLARAVSDAQFSRLCGIMQNKFDKLCHLGVFFTRYGASGFPDASKGKGKKPQRSLKDARATQVLFHAKTGKNVIVLKEKDILALASPGTLVRLLEEKIRDIEEATGLDLDFDSDWRETILPPHMAKHLYEMALR